MGIRLRETGGHGIVVKGIWSKKWDLEGGRWYGKPQKKI